MFVKLALLSLLSAVLAIDEPIQSFVDNEIVPDVLVKAPDSVLKVIFPDGVEAQQGNELTIAQVSSEPTLEWNFDPERNYSLIFCDADAPSRANPEGRSHLHWLVVNIPGSDVTSGETLATFLRSHPEPKTGLHRYIFLIYEQSEAVVVEETADNSIERAGFSPEDFAVKHNLGSPIAGNFYQTQNLEDDEVTVSEN